MLKNGLPYRQRCLVLAAALLTLGPTSCGGQEAGSTDHSREGELTVNSMAAQPDPAESATESAEPAAQPAEPSESEDKTQLATFGAGCFWCVEAVYQQLEGVISVESGYSGGRLRNPTYKQVCTGRTGHAEVCQIRFDPDKISYDELLEVFWQTHDPTTLNRQGADVGTQYRSVIFYHNEKQKIAAEQRKRDLDKAGIWKNRIVTEISPYKIMYKAEDYHQNFYSDNPLHGYCRAVIRPKVEKFRKVFEKKLKTEQ